MSADAVPPLVARSLQRRLEAVPTTTLVVLDWSSPEGQLFWDGVYAAIDGGSHISDLAIVVGLEQLESRYRIEMNRRKHA